MSKPVLVAQVTGRAADVSTKKGEDYHSFFSKDDFSALCVCDGHGSHHAAKYVAERLPQSLYYSVIYNQDVVEHVRMFDVCLLRHLEKRKLRFNPGTTLSLLTHQEEKVTVVSLGDSSVYLYCNYVVQPDLVTHLESQTRGLLVHVFQDLSCTLYEFNSTPWLNTDRAGLTGSINMPSALGDWHLKNKDVYNEFCSKIRGKCKPWDSVLRNKWCENHSLKCDPWWSDTAFESWVSDYEHRSLENRFGWVSNTPTVTEIPPTQLVDMLGGPGKTGLFVVCTDGVTDNLADLGRQNSVSDRELCENKARVLCEDIQEKYDGSDATLSDVCKFIVCSAKKRDLKPDDITAAVLRITI